jgi:RimJ/RimL family protein N-acetyltransferase
MKWIPHPLVLENDMVQLAPLSEQHFETLIALAADRAIWTHLPADRSQAAAMRTDLQAALLKRMSGEQYPFTVIDKRNGRIIGSTRLMHLFPEHKKLEIGATWYIPAYWGSGYNMACKFLLLQYCFEQLGTIRVQLVAKEENLRSRAAIRKLGAVEEGILRNERIQDHGQGPRNTVMYSIIDSEWPLVKPLLQEKLDLSFACASN